MDSRNLLDPSTAYAIKKNQDPLVAAFTACRPNIACFDAQERSSRDHLRDPFPPAQD